MPPKEENLFFKKKKSHSHVHLLNSHTYKTPTKPSIHAQHYHINSTYQNTSSK